MKKKILIAALSGIGALSFLIGCAIDDHIGLGQFVWTFGFWAIGAACGKVAEKLGGYDKETV